ncbi:hypothetical protein [Streptomyces sp. NPDC001985]|uniref:hypothetical protein n=1 Tax=Streptomyces sp. NPDC001985 TaxID=3154406 RepID=UPI00331E7FE4
MNNRHRNRRRARMKRSGSIPPHRPHPAKPQQPSPEVPPAVTEENPPTEQA